MMSNTKSNNCNINNIPNPILDISEISEELSPPIQGYNERYEYEDPIYKYYNTKWILCGKYIKQISYSTDGNEYYRIKKYDSKTGEPIKSWNYKTNNTMEKVLAFSRANDQILKTCIILTFPKNTGLKEMVKIFDDWKEELKKTVDFQYLRVTERGDENPNNINFNLLTTLDVDVNTTMFVKSARDWFPDEYNLTNWKYHNTVYRLKDNDDLMRWTIYSSKYVNVKDFPPKTRKFSYSKDLIKPRVLCYNTYQNQQEIDEVLKNTELIDIRQYQSHWNSNIEVKLFRKVYAVANTSVTPGDYG